VRPTYTVPRWTIDRTWKLVNSIDDDEMIKQGLFPTPGGNKSVSKGGSQTKTDHHWALACHVFEGDAEIKEIFLRVTEAADMKIWGRKIKNRIDRYV
jgi:hypothetical protein